MGGRTEPIELGGAGLAQGAEGQIYLMDIEVTAHLEFWFNVGRRPNPFRLFVGDGRKKIE